MKISYNQRIAVIFGAAILVVLLMGFSARSNHGQLPAQIPASGQNPDVAAAKNIGAEGAAQEVVAPFIIQDADNDSPGTNIVTRIVTFSAKIGGEPAPVLQWKVNKGSGYETIVGATNVYLRIGNAQVSDSGAYVLFATNIAGSLHTTPQKISIIEGED